MKKINIQIFKDGDKICCLVGNDLQDGISGFGKTITEAINNFMDSWGNDNKSVWYQHWAYKYLNDESEDFPKGMRENERNTKTS